MGTVFKLLIATRPKTLVAIVAPLLIAAAFTKYTTGRFELFWLSIVFITALLIQIATNFYNDALDGEEKRDTKNRLGPKRFSGDDIAFSKLLKKMALVCLFAAFILGLVLTSKSGFLILLVGLPALVLAYLYTGTKYSLSVNGVADIFVVFYFGIIPVSMTYYILTGEFSFDSCIMGLSCGLLSNALLVVNNLRDEEEDLTSSKKTLVVRFGRSFGLKILAFCIFVPHAINLYWLKTEFFRAGLWALASFPVALFVFHLVLRNKPSKKYNFYLAITALHLLFFSVMFSLGVASS